MLIGSSDPAIHQQYPYAKIAEADQTGAVEKTDNASKIESPGDSKEPRDEYIPSGDQPDKSPGIYRLELDENGRHKIAFDRPDSSEKSGDKKEGALCTASTDKVDAEIKKLKEKKQQIEQQLISTRDDKDKQRQLQMQLSQVESELSAKDNDGYRKQQATYTNR